jgi:Fe-Mn family superoxide dismutase
MKTDSSIKSETAPLTLPPLPWPADALSPVISSRTIDLHYGKHHRAYFDKLNALIAGTDLEHAPLHDIVVKTHGDPARAAIFNNAGQALNHSLYWESLTPKSNRPSETMRSLLERDLGGYDTFLKDLAARATGLFGSGWAWLASNKGKLEIVTTHDADTPLTRGMTPLLTIDVWEHAYYLDYQNRRDEHVRAVVSKLLNWEFADKSLNSTHGR